MPRARMRRTTLIAILVLLGLPAAATLVIAAGLYRRERHAAAKLEEVRALAPIGTPSDEAAARLRAAGFTVGESYKPVADGDYSIMLIPIRTSRSTLESMEYTITGGGRLFGGRAYVIINLDLEGRITSVE